MLRLAVPIFAVLTVVGAAACGPVSRPDLLVDEGAFVQCRFDPPERASDPERQRALFSIARSGGIIAAATPASRWITRQTDDGWSLRGGLATTLMGAGFLVVGALGGGLLLALKRRKPRPAWGDVLHQRFLDELRQLRGMGIEGRQDVALAALVARFSDVLEALQQRAKALAERCRALGTRGESTSARAHLVNAEDDLARLLQKVEQLHIDIGAWQHRAETMGEAAVDEAIATRLRQLREALEAAA
jgi:hypothetical protein